MRTVAGYIAAMHGGNWIITDSDTLFLVPFAREFFVPVLAADKSSAIAFGDTILLL